MLSPELFTRNIPKTLRVGMRAKMTIEGWKRGHLNESLRSAFLRKTTKHKQRTKRFTNTKMFTRDNGVAICDRRYNSFMRNPPNINSAMLKPSEKTIFSGALNSPSLKTFRNRKPGRNEIKTNTNTCLKIGISRITAAFVKSNRNTTRTNPNGKVSLFTKLTLLRFI